MFVGRKNELEMLEQMYASDRFECMILYGRRRVGKTALINEFLKGKRSIYFMAADTLAENNLAALSRSILSLDHRDSAALSYHSFDDALDAVGQAAEQERLVFVIDEYPYLAGSAPEISSLLQRQIDLHYQRSGKLMIILCGSSMSFMENQVLGYQSPLYGRRTAQLKLQPFSFLETRGFFRSYSDEEKAISYGITGGIPQYILRIDEHLSLRENIIRQFLSPNGYLFEEPENLLKQELREPGVYNGIIQAVAEGYVRLSEISTRTGIQAGSLIPYLKRLQELGIIRKELPAAETSEKRGHYAISDGMFRFWYTVVPNRLALIQRGLGAQAYAAAEPSIETLMGGTFEQICQEYLFSRYEEMPIAFQNVGRWWGTDPKTRQTEEIDIVAWNRREAVFAECKWESRLTGAEVLDTLLRRSSLLDFRRKEYLLFSRAGFTRQCQQRASEQNVRLIAFSEMCREHPAH